MDPKSELARVPTFTKVRAVICAMIVNIMIGAYYFFSNINLYVAAYLRSYNPEVNSKDTLLIMPIYIVCQSLGTILSITLVGKFGYVKVSNYSYFGFASCSLLMVVTTNYWVFVFLYGVCAGLFIGTGYMPALFIAWSYYPDSKSIVTGISLFTAGISASILSPISTMIVNPENKKDYESDPEVYGRVPFLFFCLFMYYGGLITIGSLLQPPEFTSQSLKELQELKKIDDANKEELNAGVEMEVINAPKDGQVNVAIPSLDHIGTKSPHNEPSGPADGILGDRELEVAVNKELKNDIVGAQAGFVATLPPEKLVNLVMTKKSIQVLINDRKESIRQSIRQSMQRQSVRQSVAKIHGLKGNLPADSKKVDELEKQAMDLVNKPKEQVLPKEEEERIRASLRLEVGQAKADCPSLGYALTSWSYISLAIMAYSCSIYNYFMNSVWKQFYVSKIDVSDGQMALILSYGAFANAIVRVISGFAMMRYDFKYIYLILVTSTILCCFTIDHLLVNYAVGVAYSMSVFGGIGIQLIIFPTVCTQVFGLQIGGKVFPFVFSFFSMANLTQYFILKFTEDWAFMFWLFGVIACVGFVFGVMFTSKPDWRDANYEYQRAKMLEGEATDKALIAK